MIQPAATVTHLLQYGFPSTKDRVYGSMVDEILALPLPQLEPTLLPNLQALLSKTTTIAIILIFHSMLIIKYR